MAYDSNGVWQMEDADVNKQLAKTIDAGGPLMQQAQAAGLRTANRRGLLNSSLAAESSQNALYGEALPIASQNSQQINQTNLSKMGIDSDQTIAQANIASNDREKLAAAQASAAQTYASLLENITNNTNIPAAYRDKLLANAAALRSNDYNLLEQTYGVNLDWASPTI